MNPRRPTLIRAATVLLLAAASGVAQPYAIVDTALNKTYDTAAKIPFPASGLAFDGQDAQHVGAHAAYQDNGDGTVTDLVTGLMWQKDPEVKMTLSQAVAGAPLLGLGGHGDWRLPSVKELYSLIRFDGVFFESSMAGSKPFINTDSFVLHYGNVAIERWYDVQFVSSTNYTGLTMYGAQTVFGVNFADGRIKGYPIFDTTGAETYFFVRYVRNNPLYGVNDYVNGGDGTVTDQATGLMWMKNDSGAFNAGPFANGTLNWQQALAWAENLNFAGHSDWRLPNAKELQSIVDYNESPDGTARAAIDPLHFNISNLESYFWTSTTILDGDPLTQPKWAVYIAFGQAWGYMPDGMGGYDFLNVHGAGSQRASLKVGPNPYPTGHGPQGDEVRIYNYVRAVRGGIGTSLEGDAYSVSAALGGVINLALDAGSTNANRGYFIAGSFSGTRPGFPLAPGVIVPLNYDAMSAWTIGMTNTPALQNFSGVLDGSGMASATLSSLGPVPAFAGLDLYLAYTTLGPFDYASNAISISIDP